MTFNINNGISIRKHIDRHSYSKTHTQIKQIKWIYSIVLRGEGGSRIESG